MEFQTLLRGCGIDSKDVALCLHKPSHPLERRAVTRLAAIGSPLFEAYQSTHGHGIEATVKARPYFASFLTRGDGTQLFIGLYRRADWTDPTGPSFNSDPVFAEMMRHFVDVPGFAERGFAKRARFQLDLLPELADLRGRLVVADPKGIRYVRLGETTPLIVVRITEHPFEPA